MRQRVSLDEIRTAILRSQVVAFHYRGVPVRVEPRLLGQGGRYSAYLVLGWRLDGEEGWQLFRYADISGLQIQPNRINVTRPGGAKLRSSFTVVDTWGTPLLDLGPTR